MRLKQIEANPLNIEVSDPLIAILSLIQLYYIEMNPSKYAKDVAAIR